MHYILRIQLGTDPAQVATRIAAELDVVLGEEVGVRHRGRRDFTHEQTRLLVLTDGMFPHDAKWRVLIHCRLTRSNAA